jgi:hypothetical protein
MHVGGVPELRQQPESLHPPPSPAGSGQHGCPGPPHAVHAPWVQNDVPEEQAWPSSTHCPESQQPPSHGVPDVQHAWPTTPQFPNESAAQPMSFAAWLAQLAWMASVVACVSVVPSASHLICEASQSAYA